MRDRGEVLAEIGAALNELVGHGLSHLAPASCERITTLAVSAHGADLPRMERLLKTLASEIQLQLSRDAQADTGNLLTTAARVEALRGALRTPTPALLGRLSQRIYEVKGLELLGMGAAQWRTKSRFVGLTVYFWNLQAGEWMTWSDARPDNSPDGFTPRKRLDAPGPWGGCLSPAAISRKRLTLRHARRNARRAASPVAKTRSPKPVMPALREAPAPITAWDTIAERAFALFSAGFQDWDERRCPALSSNRRNGDRRISRDPPGAGVAAVGCGRQSVASRSAVHAKRLPISLPTWNSSTGRPAPACSVRCASATARCISSRWCSIRVNAPFTSPLTARPASPLLQKITKPSSPVHRRAGGGRSPLTRIGALLHAALSEVEIIAEGGVSAYYDTARLEELATRCSALGLSRHRHKYHTIAHGIGSCGIP